MEEPKNRLQKARAAAGFKSPAEAARAFPRLINQNTLTSNENGNRPISRKMAPIYADVFGVDAGWLLYGQKGKGAQTSEVDVPVLSMVSAGNLRHQPTVEEHDVLRRIKIGDLPEGEWVALQVDGDSMNRVAPDGAIIVINRADTRLIDGRFYVFSLDEGEATFKMFKRDPDRLQPFSTNPDHMATPADREDLYVFGRVRRVIHDI
ncbi:SOS-response transcriptional repressor LexA [Ancylobacter sp. 3268]|uniref:LexA family transcriptional regulator n=1 Tax=Ancylobacter sp. 3268 TaxID=2817752 RepID=UPI00285E2CEC|nr:LexA family transcriptional regulator [Ancylobacter sp. 3268]MDR6954183.1 SOS-response transcriptional repressor LexA [Ancylobacter sp. 3268]